MVGGEGALLLPARLERAAAGGTARAVLCRGGGQVSGGTGEGEVGHEAGTHLAQACVQDVFNLTQRCGGMLHTPVFQAAHDLVSQGVPLDVEFGAHRRLLAQGGSYALQSTPSRFFCKPSLPPHAKY